MTNDFELESLVNKLGDFKKMYHQMRVIDPRKKRVMHYQEGSLILTEEICHQGWANQGICDNCISMRAYNEDDTIIKLEYTPEKIYMVMAVPVEIKNEKVIVELLKDVTTSMVMNDGGFDSYVDMKDLLDETNLKAVTDELTGGYNKRYIIEKLPVEIVASHLNNIDLSIIIADIDHFKYINDTYGHLAGDYILKEFAYLLKENIRVEKDWVARFGGEEFLICLGDTNKSTAYAIAERMRSCLEGGKYLYDGKTIHITSSFGICNLSDIQSKTYEKLIECADKKLYEAKSGGRNCVVM